MSLGYFVQYTKTNFSQDNLGTAVGLSFFIGEGVREILGST